MTRGAFALVAATGMLLLSGCSIVDRITGDNKEVVPDLSESSLERVLLSEGEINRIIGASDVRVTGSTAEVLSDLSDNLSDTDCVGVQHTAQEEVYRGSGWTEVRDEVLRDDENGYFVNQTVVLFRSSDQAAEFFETSSAQWRECANTTLVETDDEGDSTWDIGDVSEVRDNVLSMELVLKGTRRVCQHAMGVVANLVAETVACSNGISDEAESIVTTTIDNAVRESQGA